MHIGPKDLIIGGNLPISVYPTHLNADRGFIADTFLGGKGFVEVTTSTYTVQDNDFFIFITFNGNCTLTLPDASKNKGRILIIASTSDSWVYSASNNVFSTNLTNVILGYFSNEVRTNILISNGIYWYSACLDSPYYYGLSITNSFFDIVKLYVEIYDHSRAIDKSGVIDASLGSITLTIDNSYFNMLFLKRIDNSSNQVNLIPGTGWYFEDNKTNIALSPLSAVILLNSFGKQRHYVFATYGTVTIS